MRDSMRNIEENGYVTNSKPLTKLNKNSYNKGDPIKCDCGQIIAYRKNGKLVLYCKKCKRQVPFVIEPEPMSQSHRGH